MRGLKAVATLALALALVTGSVTSAGAASRAGAPPYSGQDIVNNENTCENATCTVGGSLDRLTGALASSASISVDGTALVNGDGDGYSFVTRELSDDIGVPDGWRHAVVSVTVDLHSAAASISGAYSSSDYVESYLYLYASAPNCYCGDGTLTPRFTSAQGWTDSNGTAGEASAQQPGLTTYTFALDANPYHPDSPFGMVTVGVRLLTFAYVGKNSTSVLGTSLGTPPSRAVSTAADMTISSITVTKKG